MPRKQPNNRKGAPVALLFTFLSPFIPLLYLYQKNTSFLLAYQVLLVGAALGAAALVVYGVGAKLFGSRISGFLWVIAFVAAAFCTDPLLFAANWIGQQAGVSKYVGYGVVALAAAALLWGLGALGRKAPRELKGVFYTFVAAMLVINLFNIARVFVGQSRTALYKPSYAVEKKAGADSPSVYWLFADCMMSPEVTERYYGDCDADEFRAALDERGFTLNDGATLNTEWYTMVAVPSLFSPYYYDNTLKPLYQSGTGTRAFVAANFTAALKANSHNETLLAMREAGYTTVQLSLKMRRYQYPLGDDPFYYITDHYFPPVYESDELYFDGTPCRVIEDRGTLDADSWRTLAKLIGEKVGNRLVKRLVRDREAVTRPIDTAMDEGELRRVLLCDEGSTLNDKEAMLRYYRPMVEALNDALATTGQPRFLLAHTMMGHYPWRFTLDPALQSKKTINDDVNYAQQYAVAWRIYINLIDMIRERDPDAIIILQGDHGNARLPDGKYGAQDAQTLHNSVLSARCIPDKYLEGVPDGLLDEPLNLSRWLVNTFVGQNYDYVR